MVRFLDHFVQEFIGPAVFAIAQKESVDSFFSQNSFISYDLLHKLGIPQPIQYLLSRYPEGIPLVTIFVHPSMIEMLDSATEDAIERGSWIDSLLIVPASFGSQDASKILSLCRSVQVALKSNKAILLGESFVVSAGFVKDLTSQVSAETDPVSLLVKVSLLYIQVHNKALQAPGRAIFVVVSRLKDKLDDSAYKILMDYPSATVTLLARMSAATGDDEDCTSDRILSKRELLEGLVVSTSQS